MGFFEAVGSAAKAIGQAAEDAAGWVGHRLADVGGWFGDLYEGNLGEQTVSQSDLVKAITASRGAPEWHEGGDQAEALARKHSAVSGRVQQLSSGLEASWTGGGAEAALARIRPLSEVSEAASRTFTSNSRTVSGLAHGFDQLKASLRPVPEVPPHKNFLDELQFWRTTDTEQKIKDYNEIGQHNLARYQAYASQAQLAGQGLKIDYGQLADFGDGKIGISSPPESPVEHERGPHVPQRRAGGHESSVLPPETPPDRHSRPEPFLPSPHPPPSSPVPEMRPDGSHPPLERRAGGGPDEGTTISGWTPPEPGGPGVQGWVPASSSPNIGGGAGGSSWSPGVASGFGPTGGSGPAGGLAGGGSGRSAGGATGQGPRPGEAPAPRADANGTAAKGAAGAKGSPGMGGMGAGSKGSQGEADREHQRKYGLEDDSVFDLADGEDDRLLDPRTGMPPTPPTIGG
ncbi:hypothetical protein [Amycolatopsis sp. NPDC054798]